MPPSIATTSKHSAFSLLELSLVIAVIGLLVGGIVTGSSILKQTELQSIAGDYSKYSGAVASFQQQYGGLPGDLLDATNYWGDDAANCADATVTNGDPGTCNGDSNGNMSDNAEPYRAWQQLLLANYMNGSFTGIASSGGAVPGINVPKSRIANAGWSFGYKVSTTADTNQYNQDLTNFLAIGRPIAANALTQAAALTPLEAAQLDKKIDDGLPGTGRIVTLKPTVLANCSLNPTPGTDTLATYNVTNTSVACSLNMSLTLK